MSHGDAVNDNKGEVTGIAATSNDQHAFLSAPNGGPIRDLGTFGGTTSHGSAVTTDGRVTGSAMTSGNAARHVFLTGPGGALPLKDLDTLGGGYGEGLAINDRGQVAGTATLTEGSFRAACILKWT